MISMMMVIMMQMISQSFKSIYCAPTITLGTVCFATASRYVMQSSYTDGKSGDINRIDCFDSYVISPSMSIFCSSMHTKYFTVQCTLFNKTKTKTKSHRKSWNNRVLNMESIPPISFLLEVLAGKLSWMSVHFTLIFITGQHLPFLIPSSIKQPSHFLKAGLTFM